MPIYEQTYRRYQARGALRTLRSWPIMREALRLLLARRLFLGLLVACWVPFVGFVIYLWALTQFPQAEKLFPVGGAVFARFFHWQELLVLLVTTFAGAGLVASDLRTGAILVYLSRPLTRRDYVLGKMGVLLALILSVTLVPGLLLYGVAVALAPQHFLKWSLTWIAPAVAAHSLVLAVAWSLLILAVSSLSKSARVAGLAFFGLVMTLEVLRGIVGLVYRWPGSTILSLRANLRALGDVIFGLKPGPALHWAWPALVVTAVALACLFILRSRVRAVEIVQ
jgi:ABC-2 type transport system permease protein